MSKKPIVIVGDYAEEWERQARLWPETGFMTAIIEYTMAILKGMEEQGVSRAELARRAQLKPSYVSRVLNNPENITLRTAFRLCHALDLKLGFDIHRYPDPLYELPEKPKKRVRPKLTSGKPAARARKAAAV